VNGVHIEAGGEKEKIEMFLYLLNEDAPPSSFISKFSVEDIEPLEANDFQIVESNSHGVPNLLITPDLGLCEECRNEIADPKNRRYQYPFTTCTHCGPRYTILQSLPYDRHTTSMKSFRMCPDCEKEYNSPYDRRHFSQTNSCPNCAIPVRLVGAHQNKLATSWNQALPQLVQYLAEGKIAAVKGIGGYLLIVDATNAEAIERLRNRKQRPTKPFALMYPNLESVRKDCELTPAEEKALQSIQSPIVLLKVKDHPTSGVCFREVAPSLDSIGVMRPYAALFELLLNAWGKPLIATSGNVSGSPILYEDDEAFEALKEIADVFLTHEREILISEDDSVVRFTKQNKQIIMRRSRGFAPTFVNTNINASSHCVLAMGADMKSTFALQANGQLYVSQYLGDLEMYESQEFFRHSLDHLLSLLKVKPQQIIVDAHPNYFSSQLGQKLAELWAIPLEEVYHHEAHAWSVLAENNLLKSSEPVLCVVWDGTGYGENGESWGGEFFVYNQQRLIRETHFSYTPAWHGDAMAREPRLSALFMCKDFLEEAGLRIKFNETEWGYYTKLLQSKPSHYTSSVGRLFDAVSSLLDLCDYNSFEGEAAMLLEACAVKGKCLSHYHVDCVDDNPDCASILKQIITDIDEHVPPARIAYKFHKYLADVIASVIKQKQMAHVALSGGVFQNALLVELIEHKVGSEVKVYMHRNLSPNDENIAFGQLTSVTRLNIREQEIDFENVRLY
jgi:hydrogenase maturation protein HypF